MPGESIVAFVSGGGLAALVGFIRWLIMYRAKQKKEELDRRIPRLLAEVHSVYSHMHAILHTLPTDRVVILVAKNGGEIPALGKTLYSSVEYEVHSDNIPSVKKLWQQRALDEEYIHILLRAALQKSIIVEIDHLKGYDSDAEEDWSDILRIYRAHGVAQSRVFEICATPGHYFYMSINFKERVDLSDDELVRMDAQVSHIRNVFRRHYKED